MCTPSTINSRCRRVQLLASMSMLVAFGAAGCGDSGPNWVTANRSSSQSTDVPVPTTDSPGVVLPSLPPVVAPPGATFPAPEPIAPVVPDQQAPVPVAASTGVRLSPVTVIDPASGGVNAFSVLVPAGWQAFGEVQWLPFWARLAFLQTRVFDPTTGLTIDWLPIQNFMYFTPPAGFEVPIGGNYQGKEFRPPIFDPTQFVAEYWMPNTLSHLQGATIVAIEEVPALAQAFLAGFGAPGDAGAWRSRYEYVYEGTVWEQDVTFSLLWAGNEPMSWFVNFATTAGAPKGELDRQQGLVSAVVASRATTIEWEANHRIVTQLFYQGIQQQMADTVRFGELLAQYRAESQALQQQVFDERMASLDRQNQLFRETLGGVQGYNDPVNGGVVQLPLGWDTYWVNQQGEYIAVSDPNFDPNDLNDGSWQQLQPRA